MADTRGDPDPKRSEASGVDWNDRAIDQIESTIGILRSLNDHKERMAWSSLVIFAVFVNFTARVNTTGSIWVGVLLIVLTMIIFLLCCRVLAINNGVAELANRLIRSCRFLLVRIRSGQLEVTPKDLSSEELNNRSHEEWYPKIVLVTMERLYPSLGTHGVVRSLSRIQIGLAVTVLIAALVIQLVLMFGPDLVV